jgi:hypothetical protein
MIWGTIREVITMSAMKNSRRTKSNFLALFLEWLQYVTNQSTTIIPMTGALIITNQSFVKNFM